MIGKNLRDLRRNTELLILADLLLYPSAKQKDIAENLGITVQAVSQYLSTMRREGIVRERSGRAIPTRKGMQLAQEHFNGLKKEVDGILRKIAVIDTCVAIAGKKTKKGDTVGLIMEDGMLMAYPGRDASSSGKAIEDGDEGDDILVSQLQGIVDLELGGLLIVETPSEESGGSKGASIERVRDKIDEFSPGLLVAGDATGAALLMKTSGELFTIHAPVESSMSALSKGVDVVFCGTRDSVDQILVAVSDLKRESGYDIKWKSYRA